jgi:hypothetical protein
MNAELVFDAHAFHVIPGADRPVGLDHEFRNKEQRNAAGSGRRVRQACEHEMDDVIRQVVFAIGDEDLLTEETIRAVG